MPSDRLQINTLERAVSGDINDLQSMATRMLATWFRNFGAERQLPLTGVGNLDTNPRNFSSGLDTFPSGGGASVTVNRGVLSQFSATQPAPPGALDDDMRIGFNRGPITVVHPGTASTVFLLEVQVVDVVTVQQARDVFDVPSQTFLPVLLDKQVERQIATQFVAGAGLVLPAFSGNPWVPIRYFELDAGGLWDPATASIDIDVRPDIRDFFVDEEGQGSASNSPSEITSGDVDNYSLSALLAVGGTPLALVHGNIHGRIAGHRCALSAAGTGLQSAAPLAIYARADNTLEHLYLVPFRKSTITQFPSIRSFTSAGLITSKGLLVASDVQPAPGGPHASGNLTLTGNFANFDPVPAGLALHIGSCYVAVAATPTYHWFSQDKSGACRIRNNVGALAAALKFASSAASGTFDFRGAIPDNARAVILKVSARHDGTSPSTSTITLTPAGAAGVSTEAWPFLNVPAVNEFHNWILEFPVGFDGSTNFFKQLDWVFTRVGGANNDIEFTILGWRF